MKRVSRPSRGPSSAKKRHSTKKANTHGTNNSGQIRVIGGQWRGRKLPVLNAEGLRPTTDRNKETLFNWLMPYINDARCLDVFAGSGGLGIEALSRYASYCDFIELDKAACEQLKHNLNLVGATQTAQVHSGDALTRLNDLSGKVFDIVFVDPPFAKELVAPTITALEKLNLVDKGSVIYLEHESELASPVLPENWQIIKEKRTSALCYKLIAVE